MKQVDSAADPTDDPALRALTVELNAIGDVHCQICAENIQAKMGVIAHHGYRRPEYRSGWQTASCHGARHLPYEVSADLLPDAIVKQADWLARIDAEIEVLKGTPELPNPRYERWLKAKMRPGAKEYPEPSKTLVHIEGEPSFVGGRNYEYDDALRMARYHADEDRKMVAGTLEFFKERLATWKPVSVEEQRERAGAKEEAKYAPPAPGTRSAKIAENKAKREAKEAAFLASIDLPCAHGSNRNTCKVHGHGAIFWDKNSSVGNYDNPMTMCSVKRDFLVKHRGADKNLW